MNSKRFVTIDFETYYDNEYSLSKLTTEGYVRDPRFEVIGVGVKVDTRPAMWIGPDEFRTWAKTWDWATSAVLCHHTHFDGLILTHHFGVKPALWLCTLSMGRALHGAEVGGSLAKLMTHYKVGEKGIEVHKVKGKHLPDFTPEEYARYGVYCCGDVNGTYDIFQPMAQLLPKDELKLIDLTVRMFTEPSFRLNEPLVEQFIRDEATRKQALLDRVGADRSVLMSNDKFAVLLAELGEEPPQKVSAAKSKKAGHEVMTWAFAKSDPGFQALLEHEDETIRWVAEARVGVKSTLNETRATRFLACARRGPMPVYLKYSGAHTHRFSGGDRMNFQNLQRVDENRPEVGTLRNAVLAPDGHVLVVADLAQIEARVLAWLAGQNDLVQAFSEDRDVYSEFASEAYGRKVTKADKVERFVGKTCVLGLGYGMGWLKLARTMLQGAMGGPPVQFAQKDADALSVNVRSFAADAKKMKQVEAMASRLPLDSRIIHCAVANEFIWRYRNRSRRIKAYWDSMEDMLGCMLNPQGVRAIGPLIFSHHTITGPTGLKLHYPGLQYGNDGFTYFGGKAKGRVKTYGGHLTENVVQYLARLVITEYMLKIASAYKIATTTHDEIVCVVPEKEAETAFKFMLDVMKTPPAWAPGLPVKAEGGWAKSYGEAK